MKNLLLIASFTIKEMLRKKSFWISNILTIIVIIMLIYSLGGVIRDISDQTTAEIDESKNRTIYLIFDKEEVFKEDKLLDIITSIDDESEKLLKDEKEVDYRDEKSIIASKYILNYGRGNLSDDEIRKELEEKIDNEKYYTGAIVISKENEIINFKVYARDILFQQEPFDLYSYLINEYKKSNLNDLSLEQQEMLNTTYTSEVSKVEKTMVFDKKLIVIMLISILLYFAISFSAYQVATSITTEKASRIQETLIVSASPKQIVLGKTLGIGIIGIIHALCLGIIVTVIAKGVIGNDVLNSLFDGIKISASSIMITVLYFLLGYIFYALLYALIGSIVSKTEEVKSSTLPITLLSMASFYISLISIADEERQLSYVLSLVPFSSPFSMPYRFLLDKLGDSGIAGLLISIFILVLSILLVAFIAIRIYRISVFNHGSRITLEEIQDGFIERNQGSNKKHKGRKKNTKC